jgi:hypothetical protein
MKLVCIVTKTHEFQIEGGTRQTSILNVPDSKKVEEAIEQWEVTNEKKCFQHFPLKREAIALHAVKIPDFDNLHALERQIALHGAHEALFEVCCVFFQLKQRPKEALRRLDNEIINEALDKGWDPNEEDILEVFSEALSESDDGELADWYREDILADSKEDIRRAIERFPGQYEIAAEEFLEGYREFL